MTDYDDSEFNYRRVAAFVGMTGRVLQDPARGTVGPGLRRDDGSWGHLISPSPVQGRGDHRVTVGYDDSALYSRELGSDCGHFWAFHAS